MSELEELKEVRWFKHEKLIGWNPPPESVVKINTDGASRENPGLSGMDSVLSDHYGNRVAGAT